jgi:hypothetical protein
MTMFFIDWAVLDAVKFFLFISAFTVLSFWISYCGDKK